MSSQIEQVQMWRDRFGSLHETEEQAERAETGMVRFRAVVALLDDGGDPIIRFASTIHCADWIVRNREQLIEALK